MPSDRLYELKSIIGVEVCDDLLYRILFEMNRYFDKQLTDAIQKCQKKYFRVFNQKERNMLRKYFYYKMPIVLESLNIDDFDSITYSLKDSKIILEECLKRIKTYGKDNIVASFKERKKNFDFNKITDNSEEWLMYYDKKRSKNFNYSLFILTITQDLFKNYNYNVNSFCEIIASIYDKLENYRHLIIKVKGILRDENKIDVTWKVLYKLGVYCENFVQYKDKFYPFRKNKSINKLKKFMDERFINRDNLQLVSEFYSSISTGFKFEDCLISDAQETIIMIYKKIYLDNSPIPCPACMTTIQRGNSFPEVFLRSYECENPKCPERSKSGRGKRFDEFGVYRYFKLVEDSVENKISYDIYEKWRRDIFSNDCNENEMLLRYYAWENEKVYVLGEKIQSSGNRVVYNINHLMIEDKYINNFENLPIVILFKKISNLIERKTGEYILTNDIELRNDNSSFGLRKLAPNQVGAAITSPPYYNAREYSQWPTLIMYLIDMMINAASVYDSLISNSYYLYNIGDIVNADNIFVESNMSKRRLQLGFLSCMLFELIGFNLEGNIIWDKGQVQSKRNSTVNFNSGYVKCINCYEHVFVFKKGEVRPNEHVSYNTYFSPVIKINSKGQNTYKHTAPYPPEMINLLKPFIRSNKYVLDPFLGSGTTVKWCKENSYKGLGFELNAEYFELCKKRIFED